VFLIYIRKHDYEAWKMFGKVQSISIARKAPEYHQARNEEALIVPVGGLPQSTVMPQFLDSCQTQGDFKLPEA
jgi:hypothetical protein